MMIHAIWKHSEAHGIIEATYTKETWAQRLKMIADNGGTVISTEEITPLEALKRRATA